VYEACPLAYNPGMDNSLPQRLRSLLDALECGLVERRQAVRLCLLAALAGEHTLLMARRARPRASWRGACTPCSAMRVTSSVC